MDHNRKLTALLVSSPGIVREASMVMLGSMPQIQQLEVASGALSAIERLQNGSKYLLVIDANLPADEVGSLVRWARQNRPDTKCVVLVRDVAELEQARSAGADAVFLRSASARQIVETLWPAEQEQ